MQVLVSILLAVLQFLPLVGAGSAEATGRALAQQANYQVVTLPEDGAQSVSIIFDVTDEQYLALYAPAVLRAFVEEALSCQTQFAPAATQEVTVVLMGRRHLAGETSLHLLGYVLTILAGGAEGLSAKKYGQFRVVELNADEDRVPPALIEAVGWLVAG